MKINLNMKVNKLKNIIKEHINFLKEQEEQRAKGNYYNYNLDAEGNILGWQPDMGLKDIEVNTGDQPHSDLMETEEFWTVDEKGNPVKKNTNQKPN